MRAVFEVSNTLGVGDFTWREGYPLVYDPREKQYRGSLVGLKPDTLYDIRLQAGGDTIVISSGVEDLMCTIVNLGLPG
jgi:hypothetical protein